MVIYDITSPLTFQNVQKWLKELRENSDQDIIIMIIGNKCDLAKDHKDENGNLVGSLRSVQFEDGLKIAEREIALFFETSATDGATVQAAFNKLIEKVVEYHERTELKAEIQPLPGVETKKGKCICVVCQNTIETNHCIYYSGQPYHIECVKCSMCKKIFQELGDHLNIIFNGEKNFDHSAKRNEWNPIFNCINGIFNIYNNCNFDTFELINNEKVKSMSKINFTLAFVKKLVICIIRLTLNRPIILVTPGDVSLLCVSFLHKLVKIASKDEDFIWKCHQNNFHREIQQDEAKELLQKSSSDKSTNINNNCINESNTKIAPQNLLINDEKNSDIVELQQIHVTSINTDKIAGILSRVGIKSLPS